MPESLKDFFASDFFMPHGHCYLWKPALVWLQVLSNGGIAAAYIAIFATLVYLVRSIRDIPFQRMYVAFAIFIVACGITHIFDVYVIWHPAYWLDGGVRAVTAVASIGTALLLPPLVPKAVALAEAAAVSHERGVQLEQANKELAVLLDRTQELEQLKTQFFANVSHELRTPLALIIGPAEKLLSAANLSPDQRHDLEVVGRNARSLLKHVNDLLDVSKLEAGRLQTEYTEVDVAQIVRLVAANFDGVAQERSITFVVDAPDTLQGQVDTDKLQRIILNLLSNAFKFTPSGGRIRCSLQARDDGNGAQLEVADSGAGIRPQDRSVIFERFRQAEGGATRKHGGTGLGLAIAKEFIELHGGTIGVEDAPDGGALFKLELPLQAPSGVPVAAAKPVAESADGAMRQALDELRARVDAAVPDASGTQPLVLVVEDNPEMNRFISNTLRADHRVAVAFDGREGLQRATQLKPDLIVSDIMMPGLSGDELVREVRARDELDGVPIILLTAKADDELRVRLLRQGAQDYLMKPFSADELRARATNLVTMKRVRDVLQQELESQMKDLEVLAREVTGRKRELQTALASMKVARDQAQHASQLKTSFLGMVSHEFRSPVTALQLQLERLRRDLGASLTDRQRRLLERMSTSAARLTGLVESLLQHAQIESGRLSVDVNPFDLGALVEATVKELQPRAEHRGLQLRRKVLADLPDLCSDASVTRLILINLIENALKFTEQGFVEVAIDYDGSAHRVIIKDTGPGIRPEDQSRVFEPFAQLEEVKKKHVPGVGLGLALVKEMAAALGGGIELSSNIGEGSTFTVILPPAPRESRRAS